MADEIIPPLQYVSRLETTRETTRGSGPPSEEYLNEYVSSFRRLTPVSLRGLKDKASAS